MNLSCVMQQPEVQPAFIKCLRQALSLLTVKLMKMETVAVTGY